MQKGSAYFKNNTVKAKVSKPAVVNGGHFLMGSLHYPTNPYFQFVTDKNILDYTIPIDQRKVKSKKINEWVYVGEPCYNNVWCLFVSLVAHSTYTSHRDVLGYLLDNEISFRMIKGLNEHYFLNNGAFGDGEVGKVFTIFPKSISDAQKIAFDLSGLLAESAGPDIEKAVKIGNCLYASIAKVSESVEDGAVVKITNFSVPGRRRDVPFEVTKRDWKRTKRRFFLGTWYAPTQVLRTSAKGNVYRAISWKYFSFKDVIIKEARPSAVADSLFRTSSDRIAMQARVTREIQAKVPCPKFVDYFEQNGYSYFVMEEIKGDPIVKIIMEERGGQKWREMSAESKNKLIKLFANVLLVVKAMHGAGYYHRDITATNFILTPTGEMKVIDPELCYGFKKEKPEAPFFSGTPGYRAPEQFAYQEPTEKEDIHSLGALLSLIATGCIHTY
ncbi:protein kinase [Chitinophaga sedimenti]|uniref:serine/threonine protein kinase n=1 Tax=Chitinophaga sedimenti TaxID=2033606 RepID=UPI0020045E72|nr:protein kinase [Chitinophaga sedimenti]MCK7559449.1 protein kinase [Chitinophaga sedimenti]